MKRLQIGVIGSAGPEEYPQKKPNKKIYQLAEEVGRLVAENGAILVTGGKGELWKRPAAEQKVKEVSPWGLLKVRSVRLQTLM